MPSFKNAFGRFRGSKRGGEASMDFKAFQETQRQQTGITYLPLENTEIRILTIQLGLKSDPIICTLSHTQIYATAYTALSYCWGDSNDSVPITVNNCIVPVTQNLFAALLELRWQAYTVIWVDALCINQADTTERNHQILRMRDIYYTASQTIAWLGSDLGDHAKLAFQFFSDFQYFSDINFEAIKALLAVRYWKRTWIIQELALSRSVVFLWGLHMLTLETLQDKFDRLRMMPLAYSLNGYTELKGILLIAKMVHRGEGTVGSDVDLQSALSFSCLSKASEPKDKIFGILGLTCDGETLVPSPDYGRSLDEILRDMTMSTLKRSPNGLLKKAIGHHLPG